MKSVVAAVVTAFILMGVAGPTHAAGPNQQTSAAHEARSAELVTIMLDSLGFEAMLAREVDGLGKIFVQDKDMPPDWEPVLDRVGAEVLADMRPVLIELLGGELAKELTAAELDAGLRLFRSSGARATFASVGRGEQPVVTAAQQRELRELGSSPAAQSFLRKVEDFTAIMERIQPNLMRRLVPVMFRRIGESLMAHEAAREAAAAN